MHRSNMLMHFLAFSFSALYVHLILEGKKCNKGAQFGGHTIWEVFSQKTVSDSVQVPNPMV